MATRISSLQIGVDWRISTLEPSFAATPMSWTSIEL